MTSVPRLARVQPASTVLWHAPTSPRDIDEPVLRDTPDHAAWLAAMAEHPGDDVDGRLGMHGRVESELVAGEPVLVVGGAEDGWVQVRAPWQPHPEDERGYPGWVRAEHLHPIDDVDAAHHLPSPTEHRVEAVEIARDHLGLEYLWGGTTAAGLDCSGLVHHIWRSWGLVVPRDAWAQALACEPVELGSERAGDLYFFARPGQRIHHVGIVVRPGRMVHASEIGGRLVEEDLTPQRRDTLVTAGRLPRVQ